MSLLRLLGYATVTMLAMPVENAMTQQVPIPQFASQIPGPAPGTAMTKAYVQMVGRMAYLWAGARVV